MSTATQERIHSAVKVRAVNTTDLTVDIVASTDSLDSYNSRIDPAGWELEQFKRNPQILYAHDDRGFTPSAGLPVARALPETIRSEGNKLLMRLQFTPKDVNEFGYKVFQLIANGFLNGVSVGFEAIEWSDEEDQDGVYVRTYKRQKLLEVSVVTIPANDDALVIGRAKQMNREGEVDNFRKMLLDVEERSKELETDATNKAVAASSEDIEKWQRYFEQKQPVNKLASGVLKKFFTKVVGAEPPADEKEAWTRMGEVVDAMEDTKEEPKPEDAKVETAAEEKTEEKPPEAAPVEPIIPTPPAEAPQEARKAFVQVPFKLLNDLPSLTRAYTEAGVEALRRGASVKDALTLIDGMNNVVVNSFTTTTDGNDH